MEIRNQTPFMYAHIAGRLPFPGHSLTLVVKGTFDLKPGQIAKPAEEQLYPTGDEYYPDDDEMSGCLRYEQDYAYFKPRTDLLLAGHCHSLGGKPVPASRVTFRVGTHSRSLYVFGNRFWKGPPGMRVISKPEPFTMMELRYENSYGGPGYEQNPVGKGFRKEKDESGSNEWPLPNIEDPEHLIDSPDSSPEPAGYGPLGRMWKQRFSKTGTYTGDWKTKRWPWFPEDFEWSHFNAASPVMQVEGYLRGDEPIMFENLHPEHPRYESRLPGVRVRCFLHRYAEPGDMKHMKFSEVTMRLDTLWADMDNEKVVLVWRGSAKVSSEEYEEIQHVYIMSEPVEQEPASIERCYEMFLAAEKAEEEEFAAEPEPPEVPEKAAPKIAVPGVAAAVPGVAAAEEMKETEKEVQEEKAPKIDPAAVKAQAKTMLAHSGVDLDKLTPEKRAAVEQEMDSMINKMAENDPLKILEEQQAKLQSGLADTFSKLGIDTGNLPPVSEKAKQEQVRMLRELGMEDTESLLRNPDMAYILNSMMALYPKMGIDPENLTPLIEASKKHMEMLKKQMPGYTMKTGAEEPETPDENRETDNE